MAELKGAVAVVTGGASGIGRALCAAALARGLRVALVDIEAARAEAAATHLTAEGGEIRPYACDVADAGQLDHLAGLIRRDFGTVNLLFNNAGVIVGGPVEKTLPADALWMLSVNVMGVLHGVQSFLPLLKSARAAGQPAHVINTGSENSLGVPVIGPTSVYTATKHAVLGLTDALRRDLAGNGIGVSLLCPGLVRTEIFDARRNRPDQFGGPKRTAPEQAERVRAMMATEGQDPALTAELCFEGIERGDFLIVTDPAIRGFATKRHSEVEAALDHIDRRLAASKL